ncbi:hypothetical protein AVEN_256578-1 [Araneus ventricosus]|uniref:Uncharacterized protein n=1 Tax=Araneus ventricosus TaxID=182803 RepID=A0A4Y2IZ53_ARAVE|nr:hypothetical protein AVEN_256578-1 [Araneus ventricosus]
MHGKGLPREPSLLLGRSFCRRVLSNVTSRSLKQHPAQPIVNEIVSLSKIGALEVDSNDIDSSCGRAQPKVDNRIAYGFAFHSKKL